MNKTEIQSDIRINFTVMLRLTESEARALSEITKYGHKAFLEGYYKHLGKSYLQPHENGVISLFETIGKELKGQLYKIDLAKKGIINALEPIKK